MTRPSNSDKSKRLIAPASLLCLLYRVSSRVTPSEPYPQALIQNCGHIAGTQIAMSHVASGEIESTII